MKLIAAAALAVLAAPVAAFPAAGEQAPGRLYVMRHTDKAASDADAAPAPAGFEGLCSMRGGGLSAAGAERAGKMAAALGGVSFAAAFSSEACRTAHAAHIVSRGLQPAAIGDPAATPEAFLARINDAARHGDVLVVLHSNWIAPLFDGRISTIEAPSWAAPQCYGDIRVFGLMDGRWTYLASEQRAVTYLQYGECENGG